MTETQVLSDTEIWTALARVPCVAPDQLRYARAVERAVLRKARAIYGLEPTLPMVHEAEARERERKAFFRGTAYSPEPARHQDVLDNLYPSLLPKTPPPLVLSTGTWVRSGRGGWQKAEESSRDVDRRGFFAAVEIVRTASDAEALAAWLRKHGEGR